MKEITQSIKVKDHRYYSSINLRGASLGDLSLMLACLKTHERKILDHIEMIEPEGELSLP